MNSITNNKNISMFRYILLSLGIMFVPAFAIASVEGAVTLTFDDANESHYEYVYPILEAADQNGVLYVPTGFIETDDYYVTWSQLTALAKSGWEVGGHSVTHAELPTLTASRMSWEIYVCYLTLNIHQLMPESFATPYGAYDPAVLKEIAKSYSSHRGYHEIGYNRWPYNKYYLHNKYITNVTTLEEVVGWVDEAMANDYWLILTFHEVLPTVDPTDSYSWTIEDFQGFVDALSARNIKAKTIKEVINGDTNVYSTSFKRGLNDWWTNAPANIVPDVFSNGSYPESRASMRMIGGATVSHLFGPKIPVTSGNEYGLRFFINTQKFTAGELGFYIDEYDTAGNWISGQWKGAANNSFVIDEAYRYTPSSANVSHASIQVYMTAGSVGTAYLDNVELFLP